MCVVALAIRLTAQVARFEPELRENAVLYVHRLTREYAELDDCAR